MFQLQSLRQLLPTECKIGAVKNNRPNLNVQVAHTKCFVYSRLHTVDGR